MLNRAVLALSLALVMPTAPALALEVTPKGVLFSDYTVDLNDALGGKTPLKNSFAITRARLGLKAKVSDDVWGLLMGDVSPNAAGRYDMYLKYGYVDVNFMGLGRVRGGQMDTLWAIPVEDEWYPFRYQGGEFTIREKLFPTQDRGVMWYGGMGPLDVALAVFNGEGDSAGESVLAPASFTKAYEGRLKFKPMDGAEIAVDARVADAPPANPKTNTLVGGLNVNLGPAVVGAEGAYNMVTDAKGTTVNGMGGSGHVYLPKMLLDHTPVLRADYYDEDPSTATSKAHVRLLAGVAYEWAKGADTMLSYEYTTYTKNTALPAEQMIGVKGKLAF